MNLKYIISSICLFVLFSIPNIGIAQLFDDFSDGEIFDNPVWLGDVSDFSVNENKLQLNAEAAGTSIIYTEVIFPDSIIWEFDFTMDFAPSGSNSLTIILASKFGGDLTDSYYLEIGESGSTDALLFYSKRSGFEQLLGKATEGTLGSEPAIARVKVVYDKDQIWTISASYNNGVIDEEIMILDDLFIPSDYHFFGLSCNYTASRKDKFYFDFFEIDSIKPDLDPPFLLSTKLISKEKLQLVFSEALQSDVSNLKSNFTFTPTSSIENILWNDLKPETITLEMKEAFISGSQYQLTISNISDIYNNISQNITTQFSIIDRPEHGDLSINEVLFNPISGADDFVEIKNISNKLIQLDSLIFYNAQNNQAAVISMDRIIKPEEIIAFTTNKQLLLDIYPKNDENQIVQNKLPRMNNDDGDIGIYRFENNQYIQIDSFHYNEEYHFPFLTDINGVSLEKINASLPSENQSNWHSAASTYNYASPGIKNSVDISTTLETTDKFQFQTKTFSPDGDGFEDILALQYNVEENDYLFNIIIYNNRGVFIKNLYTNVSLPSEGLITWDGINEKGELSPIGIYIMEINYFSINQNQNGIKKTFVLARQL